MAKLTSDVEYIKKDVADIKIDLRRVDDKLGAMDGRLHQLAGRFDQLEGTICAEILSLKVWGLGLYIALAGSLLFVMGEGFKWL